MITACSENKCPSSVCNRYFTVDNFNCSQTSDLRQARGIVRSVAYEQDAHTDQIPILPGVGTQGDSYEPESEDGHIQHLLQTTGREQLALGIIQSYNYKRNSRPRGRPSGSKRNRPNHA